MCHNALCKTCDHERATELHVCNLCHVLHCNRETYERCSVRTESLRLVEQDSARSLQLTHESDQTCHS